MVACSKNGSIESPTASTSSNTPQNVSLYLTDDPGFYDSVFIDIKSVSVLVDTCAKDTSKHSYFNQYVDTGCGDWVSLNMTPGLYNVRALSNGVDTLLASGTSLPAGQIKGIKIVLGTDTNYVTLNGVTRYLYFSNQDSAIVTIPLTGNEWQRSGRNNQMWLDFDIQHSIYVGLDRRLHLYPVFRWFIKNTTSTLSGNVTPFYAYPVIEAYNATDTAYALPNFGGNFVIPRLTPGTYTVHIWSLLPNITYGGDSTSVYGDSTSIYGHTTLAYSDTTLTNITTTAGNNTSIGSIVLHK